MQNKNRFRGTNKISYQLNDSKQPIIQIENKKVENKRVEKEAVKTYYVTDVWRNRLCKKIFLDILGNTQFRRCKESKKQFITKLNSLVYDQKQGDNGIYDEIHEWFHEELLVNDSKLMGIWEDNHYFRMKDRATKIVVFINDFCKMNPNNSFYNSFYSQMRNDRKHGGGYDLKLPKNIEWMQSLKILDLGCAEGTITSCLGSLLNSPKENVHGCDIIDLDQEEQYNRQFTYNHIGDSDESLLPYESNSFDVIVALMSLHHIQNVELTLREINRVLKPGGLLIIREHDCVIRELRSVLDIVHAFYALVWSNPRELEDFSTYYSHYRRSVDWRNLITRTGFIECINTCRTERYPKYHKNKIINPLRYYYAVYRKLE